ncbi:MAG: imidazole glycerol phosphate synthase subunit HisF [Alphaproteobacteria bacterium]|nr:imidazole glycerol phosphate synthase subunit HisF [Alphaproteobacteria bacterium]
MITKRIIPCLDIKDGQTVKGVHFENLAKAGDPVSLAEKYYNDGADELVFLDITATNDKRKTILDVVEAVASKVFIPLTVGGGIRSIEDIHNLLLAGADKVSLNTAAVVNPQLIYEGAKTFGSQCITIAVDVKKIENTYFVVTNAGTKKTDYTVTEWVKKITDLGAGEILLTSMDTDGTKAGYDLEVTQLVSDMTNLPVIASGGAGANVKHFTDVFQKGHADAALAASIFHFNELPIPELKSQLKQAGVNIR